MERILSRTTGGRVILDLDVVQMVRSDPKRKSVMIDDGTPMVSRWSIQSVKTTDRVWVGG